MPDNLTSKAKKRTIGILLVIGLTAGVLGGLLGIGGGVFIVPALVFFLAFSQHRAQGTSLAIVLALSLSSVIAYSYYQSVNLLVAGEIAIGGVLGAMIGGTIVAKIKNKQLRRLFSLFMVAAAIKMIYDGCMGHTGHAGAVALVSGLSLSGALLGLGTGLLAGFLSSLLGVGGGIVMVPMITMFLGFSQQQAQGISLAAMMPIAFTGMLKHHKLGNVEFKVATWVTLGAVVGAVIGSKLAHILNGGTLKLAFGIFLIVMAGLMAAKK